MARISLTEWPFATVDHLDRWPCRRLQPTDICAALHQDRNRNWNVCLHATTNQFAIVELDGCWQLRVRICVTPRGYLDLSFPTGTTSVVMKDWVQFFERHWPNRMLFDSIVKSPRIRHTHSSTHPDSPPPPTLCALLDVRSSPDDGPVPATALSDILVHQRTGWVMRQGPGGALYLFRSPNDPHSLAKAVATVTRLPKFPYFNVGSISGPLKRGADQRKAWRLLSTCLALLIYNRTGERSGWGPPSPPNRD